MPDLHPAARTALARSVQEPAVWEVPVDRTRAADAAAYPPGGDPLERVEDLDAGGVPCRLYVPDGAAGLVVHLHGGGFVFGDIDVHDRPVRRFANLTGLAVLSVDYRRPPEHRFPSAPDDVSAVIGWLGSHRDTLGVPGPAYVHGDSAGGNLALVAALRHPGVFAAMALIYPFLDPRQGFASYDTEAEGFSRREAAWYWEQYARSDADLDDPDLAPLRSDRIGTLPPTLVVTAEHDPLRDEGEQLVHLLAEAGVRVTGTRVLGMLHGFWRHTDLFDAAAPVMAQTGAFLRLWS